jgi:hypothetical protein
MSPLDDNDTRVYLRPKRASRPERDGQNVPERRTPFLSRRHQRRLELMLAWHEQKATINGPSRSHHLAKAEALRAVLECVRTK